MGEIIVSIFIGGCLALSGVLMIVTLNKEEKTIYNSEEGEQ